MFIRRTKIGTAKDGKAYYTYRLVKNIREGNKVRQRTLLNLGRYFAIEKEYWGLLCTLIKNRLSGQKSIFMEDIPEEVSSEANRIAFRLMVADGKVDTSVEGESKEGNYQEVDVDSLEMSRPRTVGVENAGLKVMEEVDFEGILRGLKFNERQIAIVKGLVIGRMASPGSERHSYDWLCSVSGLGELLDIDFIDISHMSLYRASDMLIGKKDEIERKLFERIHGLLGLPCTVTLYDLTNTYFEGDVFCNRKALRGHSKERRTDRPLLTLGLVVDSSGFVKRSQVFAGNVSEVKTLEEMLERLNAPFGALIVMDRGLSSEDNIEWLKARGYRYLVVSRERGRCNVGEMDVSFESSSGHQIKVLVERDGDEQRLYCYSEAKARKEESMNKLHTERFEKELERLASGLKRPRTTKALGKIQERVGRLKERYKQVARHYKIEIVPDESGKKAAELRWERMPAENSRLTHPGVYCLRTNELHWDAEKLWRTYTMLTDLEAVFRSLKSELGLRPVYHRKEERCDGHLFITVLAYQFVQLIRHRLGIHGIKMSWSSIRELLSRHQRITVSFSRRDGKRLHIRKATELEPTQEKLYKALGLDSNPGGRVTLVV